MQPTTPLTPIQQYVQDFRANPTDKGLTKKIWDFLRAHYSDKWDEGSIKSLQELKAVLVDAKKPRLAAAVESVIRDNAAFNNSIEEYKQRMKSLPLELQLQIVVDLPCVDNGQLEQMGVRNPDLARIAWINANKRPLEDLGLKEQQLRELLQKHGSELKHFELRDYIDSRNAWLLALCPNIQSLVYRPLIDPDTLDPSVIFRNLRFEALESIQANNVDHKFVQYIADRFTNLQTLNLDRCLLLDRSAEAFKKMQKLTTLSLSATMVGEQTLEAVSTLPDLRVLHVGGSNTIGATASFMSDKSIAIISGMTRLTYLGLDGTSTDAILLALQNKPNLIGLSISQCPDLDNDRLAAVLALLDPKKLEALNVGWGVFGMQGLKDLSKFTNLKKLDVRSTVLTQNFISYITNLQKLEELNVSGCSIRNNGLVALSNIPNLRELRCSNCAIEDQARLFSGFQNLQKLDASKNTLGSQAISSLATLPKLTVLSLSWNPVKVEGAQILSKMNDLQSLNINHSDIYEKQAIAKIVDLPNLSDLDFSNNLEEENSDNKALLEQFHDKHPGGKVEGFTSDPYY